MEENFKVGEPVCWKSQSQGKTTSKSGNIEFIVPIGLSPFRIITVAEINSSAIMFDGIARNHKSYIVKVKDGKRKPKLYWPIVKNLKKISE